MLRKENGRRSPTGLWNGTQRESARVVREKSKEEKALKN